MAITGASVSAAPTPMPSVLRLGIQAARAGPCATPSSSTPASLAALAKHLAGRLRLSVELCPFADTTAAATALAKGSVDLALLTPATWPIVNGRGRPILTLRPQGALPRSPILAVTRATAGPLTAAAIAARRVITVKHDALGYDAARAAVATHGGDAINRQPSTAVGSFSAALATLAAGKADVALVPTDLWFVGCGASKTVCAPYRIAWQNRPIAQHAWVLRGGLPDELRYRLIGIFIALPLDNPQAFAGAAGGVRGAFEPTEASALDAGGKGR
ncbi:PhnD/SsuA/transferrin family substrate-binding protein [Sphingomonas sp. GlSt437]|uniref:PhnD/SsuA/transferrin family substrate-binding protein n=2 Tax=Pseudomonadota TaxID=1224 RepID=UPI003A89A552